VLNRFFRWTWTILQSRPVSVTLAISVTWTGLPFKNRISCTNETRRSTTTFATVSYFANRLDMATSHVEMCIAEIVHRGYLVAKSDIFYILRFGASISPQRLKQERSFSRARVSCVPRQGIWKKSWARGQGWGARAPQVGSEN